MKNLFKIAFAVILSTFIFSACEKESDELPPALKAEIATITSCMCDPYISKYRWKGETVYFRGGRGPACLFFPMYYNKDGVRFEMEAGYTYQKFSEDAVLIKSVWECK
ncbi:MAG: hypothetical protein V4708_09195 [Bacteroidota bacterium]